MINVHTDRSDQGFVLGNKVVVAEVFAKNGFLVLSSITGKEKTAEVNADQINQGKGSDDSQNLRGNGKRPDRQGHYSFFKLRKN